MSYNPGDLLIMPAGHAILYAQWEVSTYQITYKANGSTQADVVKGGYTAGGNVDLEDNLFTWNDYRFLRWNTKPDGSGDSYAAGGNIMMPRASMILYAQWEAPPATTYSITYKANGGTGSDVVKDGYAENAPVTLEGNPFSRADYSFTGWNTEANGGGAGYGAGTLFNMPADNVILYAQWTRNTTPPGNMYEVLYHANGGEGTLIDTASPYRPGALVTVLSPTGKISRVGYSFVAWNTRPDGSGDSYSPGGTFIINRNMNLYAQWRRIPGPQPPQGEVELELQDHYAYLMGYPDGTVRPGAGITREEAASIFFRLLTEESREKYLKRENNFTDVTAGRWSGTAISTLANAGILKGYSDGSFAPGKPITRAEFAAIVSRFDTRDIEDLIVFSDTAGHWAEEEIGRAAALGWIRGNPDGSFAPKKNITRAEVAALVNRMLLRLVEDETALLSGMKTWPDNSDGSKWYYLDIQEASNSHLYERIGETEYEKWTKLIADIPWSDIERPLTETAKTAAPQTMQTVKTGQAAQTAAQPMSAVSGLGSLNGIGTVHTAAAYTKVKTTAMPTIDFISTLLSSENPDDRIYNGVVTGTGIPGAKISLYLPGGKVLNGTVQADKTWSIAVDNQYISANHSIAVGAVQRTEGEKESAMFTRILYCEASGTLTRCVAGDSRIAGSAIPGTVIGLGHDSHTAGYAFYQVTADTSGSWSVDLAETPVQYDYVDIWFTLPGCATSYLWQYLD